MSLAHLNQQAIAFIKQTPKKYFIIGGLVSFGVIYAIIFYVPRTVAFSYGGDTCIQQLTLFPASHSSTSSAFKAEFRDRWKVGGIDLSATKTCFLPVKEPIKGEQIIATAPLGSLVARKHFKMIVPEAPKANMQLFEAALPAGKPIRIPLSITDATYSYELQANKLTTRCKSADEAISCDTAPLKLRQGSEYDYSLMRLFNDKASSQVSAGRMTTLKAAAVIDGSIKPDAVMYDRSTSFRFTLDKPLVSADVTLKVGAQDISTTNTIDGTKLTVNLTEELPRDAQVTLTITRVEATDGSGLIEPYAVPFTTSGGPKVTYVSVGATTVAQSAIITLTFDQALTDKDIGQYVSFTGGSASIQKLSETKVTVQLQALPLCQPFSITVKRGLESSYGLASNKDWTFASRTLCYQLTQYGTSLQGRPLHAYHFGNIGPVTMYVGAIHGNEPSSYHLMQAWIAAIEASPERIAGKQVVVIPNINPDGIAANTRTNSRGVNLNRNFPTDNWTKAINDTDGNNASGGGDAPLSEPEAAALASITKQYRPRLLLSFHAIGSLTIGDPGGYSADYAALYAAMVGYRNATGTADTFDYNITGAYEDWTYQKESIPSMIIELSSYSRVTNSGHMSALWAMLE